MNRYRLLPAILFGGILWLCGDGSAQEPLPRNTAREVYQDEPPAPAEPGFKWVRDVRYKEERHPYCKKVPEKIYKWVYDTRPDYYCLPSCPLHLFHRKNDCDGCQDCKGPYYRPQLKKMQVETTVGWNCVVDYVKEKVPYVVWRKTPINGEAEQGQPGAKMLGAMPPLNPPDNKSPEARPGPMAPPPGQSPLRDPN
jgi:hypothetical protein